MEIYPFWSTEKTTATDKSEIFCRYKKMCFTVREYRGYTGDNTNLSILLCLRQYLIEPRHERKVRECLISLCKCTVWSVFLLFGIDIINC